MDDSHIIRSDRSSRIADIHRLLDWGSPREAQPFLAVVLGGSICIALSIAVTVLGGWLFELDKTQQCIVFTGCLISFVLLIDHGTFPSHGHTALATKALVLATLQGIKDSPENAR